MVFWFTSDRAIHTEHIFTFKNARCWTTAILINKAESQEGFFLFLFFLNALLTCKIWRNGQIDRTDLLVYLKKLCSHMISKPFTSNFPESVVCLKTPDVPAHY